jgi:hypothetical protein
MSGAYLVCIFRPAICQEDGFYRKARDGFTFGTVRCDACKGHVCLAADGTMAFKPLGQPAQEVAYAHPLAATASNLLRVCLTLSGYLAARNILHAAERNGRTQDTTSRCSLLHLCCQYRVAVYIIGLKFSPLRGEG